MAETIPIDKLPLSIDQQDSDQLIGYLEENYNMPNEEWWISVDTAFQHLHTLLECHPNEAPDEENDPQSISAQAARADALPLVSLLPSGSHALRFTATNEYLQCVAFGTISSDLYVDIFWEAVSRVQDEGGKFVVYKIESGAFWFNFEGHNFQLLYIRCENLVRSCPGILNVSDEILQESDSHTQRIVEGIKRDTGKRAYFSTRSQKASHYYFRALNIARGLYTPNHSLASSRTLSFQDLVKTINSEKRLDVKVLQDAAAESVHANLEMPLYVQVIEPPPLVNLMY
ncbi:hypothetical protein N431DRAFT_153233 [Stipitochalara longipes BDJ]|nr:hypothetical protein N431DRAFT_153233 [Stipitochalara longipes BDJ]